MSRIKPLLQLLLVGLTASAWPSTGAAQDGFRVTGLGSLLGDSLPIQNRPYRLNDNSVVIGYTNGGNSHFQAATWRNGVLTQLGTFPGGTITKGHAINNSGAVAGLLNDHFNQTFGGFNNHGQWQSLLWPSSGGITYTTASAINGSNVIVGWGTTSTFDTPNRTPLLFSTDGNTHPRPLPTRSGDAYGAAFDVNNNKLAVGYTSSSASPLATHPVMWNLNTMTVTPLAGGAGSYANSINDSGAIVGAAVTSGGRMEAAKMGSFSFAALSLLPGEISSVANAVNANGMIAGSATVTSGATSVSRAFVSAGNANPNVGGVKVDLNTLINPSSGWTLNSASDVNSQGQIVGTGTLHGASAGYILTPELHRQPGTSPAWEAPGSWSWGVTPGAQHPVYIDNATVNGPVNNLTIAELNLGTAGPATLSLGSGVLTVSNQNAIWADGYTTIGTFGTLAGSGSLNSNVVNFGTISPGNSPGTLTINGNVTFEPGSIADLQVFGAGPNQHDLLNITGTASLGGELLLDFTNYAGSFNGPISVLNASGMTGSFQDIEIVGLDRGTASVRFQGNEIDVVVKGVPEPGTLVLLGVGALALLCARQAMCRHARTRSKTLIGSS